MVIISIIINRIYKKIGNLKKDKMKYVKYYKKVSESKNCSYRVFKVNGVRSKWRKKVF